MINKNRATSQSGKSRVGVTKVMLCPGLYDKGPERGDTPSQAVKKPWFFDGKRTMDHPPLTSFPGGGWQGNPCYARRSAPRHHTFAFNPQVKLADLSLQCVSFSDERHAFHRGGGNLKRKPPPCYTWRKWSARIPDESLGRISIRGLRPPIPPRIYFLTV
jgi:hypothetical protein